MKTLEQEVLKKIAKKSLFVKLVNTERNKSLVEQSISKEFLDLSAVVRVVLKMDKEGMASMTLSKRDAEILGMTEEEIYAAALKNTLRLFPPKLMNFNFVAKIFSFFFFNNNFLFSRMFITFY